MEALPDRDEKLLRLPDALQAYVAEGAQAHRGDDVLYGCFRGYPDGCYDPAYRNAYRYDASYH